MPSKPPQSQCPCHWFPVEPALRALQTGSAGGSWANTRATSSPPTIRGITPLTSSAPGTSTRRPSARSSSWCRRSSSPPRTSAATSWSCGKTVGNRACCGAHGRSGGRKRLGFGRAALCKGRKPCPRAAGGDFWELGEQGIGIALPSRCLAGSGGCTWAKRGLGRTPGCQHFFFGIKSRVRSFPEQGRNNNIPGM